MSGPVVPFLEVTEVDGSPSGRPITKLVVSNGDLSISGTTATIDTTGAGGTATLSQSQIGFGSASDLLTGSANFTFVDETGGAGPTVTLTGDKPLLILQDDTSATNFFSEFIQSGASLELRNKSSAGADVEIFRTRASSITFNDDAIDMDFIVKSDTRSSALKVDGGTGFVGINEANPEVPLEITDDGTNTTLLQLQSTDTDANVGPALSFWRNAGADAADGDNLGQIIFFGEDSSNARQQFGNFYMDADNITAGAENGSFRFEIFRQGTKVEAFRIRGSEVVVNEGSADTNFRVESNANDKCLLVDAGQSGIAVNGAYDTTIKSTPKLQILSQTGVASYAYLASSGSSPESLTNDEMQGPIYSHISSSAHTYVLPTGVKGMQFHFFSNDGNISIEPQPTDKINGGSSGATSTFSTNHQIYTCICYDTNEWVVSPPT